MITKQKLPTKEELLETKNKVVEDVIQPNLDILFCGINPGLYTAYTGFHFARPGNRFWKALYLAGLTPTQFKPSEQENLLELGMGITNVVARASATAAEISRQEYIEGGEKLRQKLLIFKPKILAILGIGAYKAAFNKKSAVVGLQPEKIGNTKIWILPNPSGLNANYSLERIADLLVELKKESSSY